MNENEPYFFNPGLTTEQLEDWLGQQRLHVAQYNRLKGERAALLQQLAQVDAALARVANSEAAGKLSFSWEPNPALKAR